MFQINKIKPAMSHEEKVYEYARRISFYGRMASHFRQQSKVFNCQHLDVNKKVVGGFYDGDPTGCLKNEDKEPCEPCKKAAIAYGYFRSNTNKKAAAFRQLNSEMSRVQELEF